MRKAKGKSDRGERFKVKEHVTGRWSGEDGVRLEKQMWRGREGGGIKRLTRGP